MKRYYCHKSVQAAKIEDTYELKNGDTLLILAGGERRIVSMGFVIQHHVQIGGYLIVHDDMSWAYLPSAKFQQEYTLAPEAAE